MTIAEIGRSLRSKKISCVELIHETLADIERRDVFHSMITLTPEQALATAAERDRELAAGVDRGPFHGVPTAYKDIFYTRGVRTTAGSLVFRDFVPDHDATVVEKLTEAGAISVGKANLHELAYGVTSKNPHYGFVLNPHDLNRIPGGSSGGSAALVAAGFLPMSLGSDTGGSIRIPASYCGIAGLKPTYGRVSRFGVFPLAYSLDHMGPLGGSVEDCASTMNVIAGPDTVFNLPSIKKASGIRIGLPTNFFFNRVADEVAAAVKKAVAVMERQGATVVEVRVPDMEAVNAAARIVQLSETASIYANHKDPKMFGETTWGLIQQGKLIAAHEYVSAQRLRTLFRREFDHLWGKIDVLAAPTTVITAPLISEDVVTINGEQEDARLASTRLVRGMNFVGEPALSIPCGKDSGGMPIGLQLISAPFNEPRLLQIGALFELHQRQA